MSPKKSLKGYTCPACNGNLELLGVRGPTPCEYCKATGRIPTKEEAEMVGYIISAGPTLLAACKMALAQNHCTPDCDKALKTAIDQAEGNA